MPWQVQDAKQKLGEFIRRALHDGARGFARPDEASKSVLTAAPDLSDLERDAEAARPLEL